MKRILVLALLAMLVGGACTFTDMFTISSSESTGGEVIVTEIMSFSGTVTGNRNDCIVDGICSLYVDSDLGEYEVIYAPGMMRCEGSYAGDAEIGDVVEVYGETVEPGVLTICTLPEYYIRK